MISLVNENLGYEAQLLQYENLLNRDGLKRYHVNAHDDWVMSLSEIVDMKERVIVDHLTAEQLVQYMRMHVKVVLNE